MGVSARPRGVRRTRNLRRGPRAHAAAGCRAITSLDLRPPPRRHRRPHRGRVKMATTDAPGPAHPAAAPLQRPVGFKLLWYSLGGSLPERHWAWVLHDGTCRTWLLRHFARTLLVVAPIFAAIMALVPASVGTRLLTGLTVSGGLFMFSLVNSLIDTDRRAVRAGYPAGLSADIRSGRSVDRQRLASSLRRERVAERRARRNGAN